MLDRIPYRDGFRMEIELGTQAKGKREVDLASVSFGYGRRGSGRGMEQLMDVQLGDPQSEAAYSLQVRVDATPTTIASRLATTDHPAGRGACTGQAQRQTGVEVDLGSGL